jgi:predicted nucleotidyltransferase
MANSFDASTSVQISPEIIDQIVKKIVELVHPLRIILFGSAARGEAKPDSDIDLLIVIPEGGHRRKTAQFLYRHIAGIKVPFDILVATPGDLERHRDNIGLIYRTVLREGKEVYVAPSA